MLAAPKGLRYWKRTKNDFKISEDAPEWAKKEFKEYQKLIVNSGKPDKNGISTLY